MYEPDSLGQLTFVEEITRFEPSKRMGYLILNKWLPPMRYHAAVVTLESHGRVRWVSSFDASTFLQRYKNCKSNVSLTVHRCRS